MRTRVVISSPNVEIVGRTLRIRDRISQESVLTLLNHVGISYWTGHINDVLIIRPARRYAVVCYSKMYVIKE